MSAVGGVHGYVAIDDATVTTAAFTTAVPDESKTETVPELGATRAPLRNIGHRSVPAVPRSIRSGRVNRAL
jgi:hypothetical protein